MANDKPNFGSKLLDHMIQRHLAEQMEQLSEEAIAQAIQTLLSEDDEKVQNIH